ncbi:MAG TPA: hypothetical protein VFH42_06920, partial [Sporolactobacillaceae bacterium]|nr:hypothetical protein [Sporolactobacillaceae bacterium]
MRFPKTGSTIEIQSYKHDGSLHRTWDETLILSGSKETIIGGNNQTIVTESDGRKWQTKEPA